VQVQRLQGVQGVQGVLVRGVRRVQEGRRATSSTPRSSTRRKS